jgi:hypothetical protein
MEEDPEYNINDPDENSPVHEKYQIAKEMGFEWGCPNWTNITKQNEYISLPEHRLEALNDSIELPKNKKMLAVINNFEKFLKVPNEIKGKCYKTCPNYYQTKGSPIAPELAEAAISQRWFEKGQYNCINPNPSMFDIDMQNALMDGQSIVENYYNNKMKKENEELKKQIKNDKMKYSK